MPVRVDPKWSARMMEMVMKVRDNVPGVSIDEILTHNVAVKHLVALMAHANVSFKIINLGAGVKRVTTYTDVCPKCNGTGRC